MEKEYSRQEIEQMQAELETLPIGYISRKKISGKEYFYRQWAEKGKTKSQYIKKSELETVQTQIARRKELQKILKDIFKEDSGESRRPEGVRQPVTEFETTVLTGEFLDRLVEGVRQYPERTLVKELAEFMYDQMDDRICLLAGLRRTGKTTMMLQAILRLSERERGRAAYIRAASDEKPALMRDIRKLAAMDYRYLFLDEILTGEDFGETVEILSDTYGEMGIKFILSGMNPIRKIYDRVLILHTTSISYREYARLLGERSISDYMQSGGLLQKGNLTLPEKQFVQAYMEHVICRNVGQEKKEIICEKIYEICEEPVLSLFRKDFKLYNWQGAAQKRRSGRTLSEEEEHIAIQYLREMDLCGEYEIRSRKEGEDRQIQEIFTIPWLRHILVKEVLEALIEDPYFAGLSERDKKLIYERMYHEAVDTMLLEIVLLEMRQAMGMDCRIFRFEKNKREILVYDRCSDECWIYLVMSGQEEDRLSEESLLEEEKKRFMEGHYGRIIDRCILYSGEEVWKENGIHYQNVESYLYGLG